MFWSLLCVFSCTTTAKTKAMDSANQSSEPHVIEEMSGAVVTSDCTYESYSYAIDILLSCGDERFDDELRLHTFKQHAWSHKKVFRDQKLTFRDEHLWFDEYQPRRCVQIEGGRWFLSTEASSCTKLALDLQDDAHFVIRDASTEQCATLGEAQCTDHEWTGGRECGGIDHRYLPLVMGNCETALQFRFETEADSCSDEYPEEACF